MKDFGLKMTVFGVLALIVAAAWLPDVTLGLGLTAGCTMLLIGFLLPSKFSSPLVVGGIALLLVIMLLNPYRTAIQIISLVVLALWIANLLFERHRHQQRRARANP